jgi:hypothetical protein
MGVSPKEIVMKFYQLATVAAVALALASGSALAQDRIQVVQSDAAAAAQSAKLHNPNTTWYVAPNQL